ncbi:MAG TPA: tyrosine-type recombinase/integrase [Xanthomonadaceae bacterium]|jgi:integrase
MARAPREHKLETRESRAKLKTRAEPYWRQVIPGTFLGYRKSKTTGAWIVRQRNESGGYSERRLGTANDHVDADGLVVLGYGEAVRRATETQLAERGAKSPRHMRDGITLNDLLDYYLAEHLAGKGSESVTRQFIDRHIRADIGAKLATALDADAIRAWHRSLAAKAPMRRQSPVGNRKSEADPAKAFDPADPASIRARQVSANRVLTIIKAALNFAWEHDKLPESTPTYWKKVTPFSVIDDEPPRMLDHDEITRLLNAALPDLRTLLSGALLTGARYGELAAMKVGSYSHEHSTVTIHQTKTGKTLHQPLTPEGIALFNSLTAGRSRSESMFTKADGTTWGKDHATRRMIAAAEAARVTDVSFKTTRATYGKLLLLATRDIEMVAKALGHSDSRITRKHYAQYLPNEVAAAVAKLPALGIKSDAKVSRIGNQRKAG